MYFLTYHSEPRKDADEIEDIGGAYINCYILADNIVQADNIARDEINKMKWNILERDDAYEIDSDSVSEEGREHYEQALIDNTAYVLHTYPVNDENSD